MNAHPTLYRLVLCAALLSFMLSGITNDAAARTLQQVRNSGELRIGIALAAPWVMRDREANFIGYEIDLGEALAADLGVDATFVLYDADELRNAVEIGEADIVVAGLQITPASAVHLNFSQPHTVAGISLATRIDATSGVESLIDLDSAAYSLAVVADSGAAQLARRLLPRIELVEFPQSSLAAAALIAGDVDAWLEEEPVPNLLAADHPGRIDVPLARPLLTRRSGFAIAKGDADFLAFLNAWIVAREDDGWLASTFAYWLRSTAWRDRVSDDVAY